MRVKKCQTQQKCSQKNPFFGGDYHQQINGKKEKMRSGGKERVRGGPQFKRDLKDLSITIDPC